MSVPLLPLIPLFPCVTFSLPESPHPNALLRVMKPTCVEGEKESGRESGERVERERERERENHGHGEMERDGETCVYIHIYTGSPVP